MDRKQYEISIRREVMLEMYAGVLVRFLDYFEKKHIDPETAIGDSDVYLFLQAVDVCRSLSDMHRRRSSSLRKDSSAFSGAWRTA